MSVQEAKPKPETLDSQCRELIAEADLNISGLLRDRSVLLRMLNERDEEPGTAEQRGREAGIREVVEYLKIAAGPATMEYVRKHFEILDDEVSDET